MSDIFTGKVTLIGKNLLAHKLEFGEQTSKGGIILKDDDMTTTGIKPRWCRVYDISPKLEKEIEIKKGQWILVEHARWSRGFKIDQGDGVELVRLIDWPDIMMVTDEKPGNFNTD